MSDVSVLSLEYRTASELSEAINALLVTLKKARLGIEDQDAEAQARFAEARDRLGQILDTLVVLLDDDSRARVSGAVAAQIPGAFVNHLLQERYGDIEWYLADLTRISQGLKADWRYLTDKDVERLDHLATVADAETSGVFRQLMRR